MARDDLQTVELATGNRLGELLRLAWPVILSRLGIMAMGLTDAIVVGQFSSRELGYHALGWAPTMVVLTTSVGLLTGVQVMTARYIGAGRPEATGGVLRRGLVYGLWIGIVSAAVLGLAGPWFLGALGLEPDLARGAGLTLQVFAIGLPSYLIAVVFQLYLEALGKPIPAMVAMWTANLVNLAFNLWLVPGESWLPVEGAVASAWATFAARTALAVMLAVYVFRWEGAQRHGLFDQPHDGQLAAADQRRIGYAAGASLLVETSAFAGMNVVAGWIGALEVAAWAIVLNVAAITFMVPLGLATATAVLVGRGYGARQQMAMVRSGTLGFAACAIVTLLICAIVWPGAELIARAYSDDPALLALVAPALVLSCLFFVADGLQVVAAQALRARGDVWVPTATHILSYAVIMLPLGWALAHPMGLGVSGIVWSVIIASLISASSLLARFYWLARRPLHATLSLP